MAREKNGYRIYKRGALFSARVFWQTTASDGKLKSANTRVALKASTHTAACREAERILARKVAERFGTIGGKTIAEAITDFEEAAPVARQQLSALTLKRYSSSLKAIKKHIGHVQIEAFDRAIMFEYQNKRRKDRVKDATIIRDFTALSQVFELIMDGNVRVEVNPVSAGIKRLRDRGLEDSSARERWFSPQELKAIVTKLRELANRQHSGKTKQTTRELEKHAYRMTEWAAEFNLETGLRSRELFMLRRRDVDTDNGWLHVRPETAKRNKARMVPLTQRAAALLDVIPRHPLTDWVFWYGKGKRYTSLLKHLKRAAKDAGVHDVIWHDIRRTTGCRWLNGGVRIEVVSKLLGHEDIETTQKHYAFLNLEELKKAAKLIDQDYIALCDQYELVSQIEAQREAVIQHNLIPHLPKKAANS